MISTQFCLINSFSSYCSMCTTLVGRMVGMYVIIYTNIFILFAAATWLRLPQSIFYCCFSDRLQRLQIRTYMYCSLYRWQWNSNTCNRVHNLFSSQFNYGLTVRESKLQGTKVVIQRFSDSTVQRTKYFAC